MAIKMGPLNSINYVLLRGDWCPQSVIVFCIPGIAMLQFLYKPPWSTLARAHLLCPGCGGCGGRGGSGGAPGGLHR